MKRFFVILLLAFAPVLFAAAKPNFIFIFADDWGYGDLSVHGSPFCKTPHLDRMARQGIRFENFTVNHPVCSPSRSAVMTGQFPARHSIHRHFATVQHHVKCDMPDWLNPKAPMLPRMLKRAGYVTGHFGKWHLTNRDINDAPLPPKYGYDEYGAFNLPGRQIETAETCPKAIDFIRRNKDKSFFINLWIHETHTPHYPLKKYLAQFKHLNEQQRVYAAIVAEADAAIGQVFETLKELKLDEKTLVIFSSDNGPENTGAATRKHHQDNSTGPGLGTYFSVGTTGGLKGRKRSLMAGGIRVHSSHVGRGKSRRGKSIKLQSSPQWICCPPFWKLPAQKPRRIMLVMAKASSPPSKANRGNGRSPFFGSGRETIARHFSGRTWAFATANGNCSSTRSRKRLSYIIYPKTGRKKIMFPKNIRKSSSD